MAPRVAFITGAAGGIGESIALRLALESEDISFLLLDLQGKEGELQNVVKKVEEKGRKAIFVTADVSVEEQVKNAVDKCVDTFGGLDIVGLQFPLSLTRVSFLIRWSPTQGLRFSSLLSRVSAFAH